LNLLFYIRAKIKDKKNCRWDLVSLGEVLLRFDSGDERIHTTQNFRVLTAAVNTMLPEI
jgi:2-dehydro-3-deoxygluconokinase